MENMVYVEDIFVYIVGLCWELLSFEVPGTGGMDGKAWVILLVIINITLAALSYAFGLGGSGTDYRSGNSRRKHISKERQGDEY